MRTMRTSMMVLGRELGPAGTAHAACHGGVVRDQAALEGPRETHGVFEGHRGLQLDIDLQGGAKPAVKMETCWSSVTPSQQVKNVSNRS